MTRVYLKNFCAAHILLLSLLWQKENIKVERIRKRNNAPYFYTSYQVTQMQYKYPYCLTWISYFLFFSKPPPCIAFFLMTQKNKIIRVISYPYVTTFRHFPSSMKVFLFIKRRGNLRILFITCLKMSWINFSGLNMTAQIYEQATCIGFLWRFYIDFESSRVREEHIFFGTELYCIDWSNMHDSIFVPRINTNAIRA